MKQGKQTLDGRQFLFFYHVFLLILAFLDARVIIFIQTSCEIVSLEPTISIILRIVLALQREPLKSRLLICIVDCVPTIAYRCLRKRFVSA